MARQIHCESCGTFLGELAIGTRIKIGTTFYCKSCSGYPETNGCNVKSDQKTENEDEILKNFMNIFNQFKK